MRQYALACISMHQHAPACVSMHQHAPVCINLESVYTKCIDNLVHSADHRVHIHIYTYISITFLTDHPVSCLRLRIDDRRFVCVLRRRCSMQCGVLTA